MGYFIVGIILTSIIGVLFNVVLVFFKNSSCVYFGPISSVFLIGFAAYAITKHELMNIKIVVSRATSWILTASFLGAIYIVFVWLYQAHVSSRIDAIFLICSILYGIFVGEAFQRLKLFLQTTAEIKFIRGFYNPNQVMRIITEKLIPVFTIEDAVITIKHVLKEQLEIEKANIYLSQKRNGLPAGGYSLFDDSAQNKDAVSSEHLLIQYLIKTRKIAFYRNLPLEIKKKIMDYGPLDGVLYLPLFSSERLEAILILGKKASENDYEPKDMTLFETIIDQALIVFDRIRPYEQVKTDLSTEKERVEIAQREMERAHRFAALGTLAAGLAHEIKNPMTLLRSRAQKQLTVACDPQFIKDSNELMIKYIDRILDIVRRMLTFAKARGDDILVVNVNRALEDTLLLVNNKIKDKGIKVITEFKTEKSIKANQVSLSEVFLNLIVNAIDFMESGGTLVLRTGEKDGNITIDVKDTGAGIPADKMEHIFDPFYTTRLEGTGLGLSIVYRTVQEYGGKINVVSEVGKGTTFTITFPAIS